MAKTKSRAITHYRAPSHARPIVIRQSAPRTKHKGHRRGHAKQSSQKMLIGLIVGGFGLGFLDKSATAIPTIPVLGKAGTIAVAAHFFGHGKPGLVTDVRNAAAAVAAYEYGSKGAISGDDMSGTI